MFPNKILIVQKKMFKKVEIAQMIVDGAFFVRECVYLLWANF